MLKPTLLRSLGLIGLCAFVTLAAHAQGQWKWRDANGNVQYSDRPPPATVPEKDILARPLGLRAPVKLQTAGEKATQPSPAGSQPAAGRTAEKAEPKQNMSPATEARLREEERRNQAVRADNCRRAKDHLAVLESGSRIALTDDKGARTLLDDAGRNAEIQKTRAIIASECN